MSSRYLGVEITSVCNAQCPWCFTRKISSGGKLDRASSLMPLERFVAIIDRLDSQGLLHDGMVVNLYAIGEPFLNPDLPAILDVLTGRNLRYALSTNGSIVKRFAEGSGALRNLANLIVSLPGFSQASYDRVHGLDFEKIKRNIVEIRTNFRSAGFSGDMRLVYHVYQHNLAEIQAAKSFAAANDIDFYPYYAILYEYRDVHDYVMGKLPYEKLQKASKEFFLSNIEKSIEARPKQYKCDFFNMLVVDVNGRFKTCCQIPAGDPDYSFGSVFEMTGEEISRQRVRQPVCKSCRTLGIDYYLSVYMPFDLPVMGDDKSDVSASRNALLDLLRGHGGGNVLLFGAGRVGLKALELLRQSGHRVNFFVDNNKMKVGTDLDGIPVISPEEIGGRADDPLVIISSINYRQISQQLQSLGVEKIHYFPPEIY